MAPLNHVERRFDSDLGIEVYCKKSIEWLKVAEGQGCR